MMCSVHTVDYRHKRNEVVTCATTQMNLRNTLSEVSQTRKATH